MPLVVATANVLGSLDRQEASRAVALVLEHRPDLVALQEWHPWRARVLRQFGGYRWYQPLLGGCALGGLEDRFAPLSRGTRLLSGPGRADRDGRPLGIEPARLASRMIQRDLETDQTVALIGYHLVSQVQSGERYREHDRPRLVDRHRRESAALRRLVAETVTAGHATYVAGDSNFHGFRLAGLVSVWDWFPTGGGTLGPRRQIDDVHGPTRPSEVVTVATPSDHLAVVATYA